MAREHSPRPIISDSAAAYGGAGATSDGRPPRGWLEPRRPEAAATPLTMPVAVARVRDSFSMMADLQSLQERSA